MEAEDTVCILKKRAARCEEAAKHSLLTGDVLDICSTIATQCSLRTKLLVGRHQEQNEFESGGEGSVAWAIGTGSIDTGWGQSCKGS